MGLNEYTDEHAKAGIDAKLPELESWANQFSGYRIKVRFPSLLPFARKQDCLTSASLRWNTSPLGAASS